MTEPFQPLEEALHRASENLLQSSDSLREANRNAIQAWQALTVAKGEHSDLRETVARLETEVLSLADRVRSLTARLENRDGE
jgi:hypothetical protein